MFKSGGHFSGSIGFANGVWNAVGDDAYIGDQNQSGAVCIKGNNGNTRLTFIPYSGSVTQSIATDGTGTMHFDGGSYKLNGNITSTGRVLSQKQFTPEASNYTDAHIVANTTDSNNSNTSRASIGFHNAGVTAGILYLDNDGNLKWMNNGGTLSKIMRSGHFSLSGTTLTIIL